MSGCYIPEVGILLPLMYPGLDSATAWTLSDDGLGCITLSNWQGPGAAPTPEQVIAYHDGPEYLAHVRGQRAAQLVAERQAALTARMGETWAGLSAGEVAISIAAQEPSASDVAAYLADRQTILAAYVTAVEALDTMTLEQLEAAIAAGGA